MIEAIHNLANLLPMDITKLEKIPYKDLQNLREDIKKWLILVNTSDREGIDTHLSPLDVDSKEEESIKNSFHINRENFETRAKDFKKLMRGEE